MRSLACPKITMSLHCVCQTNGRRAQGIIIIITIMTIIIEHQQRYQLPDGDGDCTCVRYVIGMTFAGTEHRYGVAEHTRVQCMMCRCAREALCIWWSLVMGHPCAMRAIGYRSRRNEGSLLSFTYAGVKQIHHQTPFPMGGGTGDGMENIFPFCSRNCCAFVIFESIERTQLLTCVAVLLCGTTDNGRGCN